MAHATHWKTFETESERCRFLARVARLQGNRKAWQFWLRVAEERADDARKAKKRQEVWYGK